MVKFSVRYMLTRIRVLTILHSEQPKLHRVLAVLSAKRIKLELRPKKRIAEQNLFVFARLLDQHIGKSK